MSSISVYVIVDFLSERVVHTFYAPNEPFAVRSFCTFLDQLKGRSKPSDFGLQCAGTVDSVPESYSDAIKLNESKDHPFISGVDALRSEDDAEVEYESES